MSRSSNGPAGRAEASGAGVLKKARRIVLKIGSALIVETGGRAVDGAALARLAAEAAALRTEGKEVLIVSSGAVALGGGRLGLSRTRALTLEEKQAAAAAGQSALMGAWEQAFAPFDLPVAQVLITRTDTEVRRRWLNARATIETLLRFNAMPIVNENDTVATEEIRFGDNDRLAARVAQMITADLLVLLSDVDGLYTCDPRVDPGAVRLERVTAITPEIEAMAGTANLQRGVGVGGMATKIAAAKIAGGAGCATLIAQGRPPSGEGPLEAVARGGPTTLFIPKDSPKAAYKQWIAGSLAPKGALVVDAGAAEALQRGGSLLASGVTGVEGDFDKGDAVLVKSPDGRVVAKGLAAYGDQDARAIQGQRTQTLAERLGYEGRPELVHRDHLVWLGEPASGSPA